VVLKKVDAGRFCPRINFTAVGPRCRRFSPMQWINSMLAVVLATGLPQFGPVMAQGIGVGTPAPDSSAIVDIQSAAKGLLVPRLNLAERQLIRSPAHALLIFNTSSQQFQVNLGTPTQPVWQNIVTLAQPSPYSAFWSTQGNATTDSSFFLGTTGAQPLRLATHHTVRLYLDSTAARVGVHTQAPQASLHVAGTDAIIVPVGTTAQRPVVPQVGMIRFNASINKLEGYTASQGWVPLQ
jgi:hypothetical protein